MEKINCNVIQDILPLYIDDVVSDDTKELVEEHLQNCEICHKANYGCCYGKQDCFYLSFL